jgi:Cu2+-exporting ATPase
VLGADVLLLGDTTQSALSALPGLLDTARATRRVIRENLVWAFAYNLVTIPLAVTGKLSPVAAAIAMALSSLAVVANSWRLTLLPLRSRRAETRETATRSRTEPCSPADPA